MIDFTTYIVIDQVIALFCIRFIVTISKILPGLLTNHLRILFKQKVKLVLHISDKCSLTCQT